MKTDWTTIFGWHHRKSVAMMTHLARLEFKLSGEELLVPYYVLSEQHTLLMSITYCQRKMLSDLREEFDYSSSFMKFFCLAYYRWSPMECEVGFRNYRKCNFWKIRGRLYTAFNHFMNQSRYIWFFLMQWFVKQFQLALSLEKLPL